MEKHIKIIARNKKATHDYFIEEKIECGIVLTGTEVKSLRLGKASIKESYADIIDGEVFVFQMNITPYEKGNIHNQDPIRPRKLLLHKREIRRLIGLKQRQGYTLVPLTIYFSDNRVKLELALAKGKKMHDKRQAVAEKDAKRRMDRAVRR